MSVLETCMRELERAIRILIGGKHRGNTVSIVKEREGGRDVLLRNSHRYYSVSMSRERDC